MSHYFPERVLINADKPLQWKKDSLESVRMYNSWFLTDAPEAYREVRQSTMDWIDDLMKATDYLRDISPGVLLASPDVISALRMCTAPPLARDRLAGLAHLRSNHLLKTMEDGRLPKRNRDALGRRLRQISNIISELLDTALFPWTEDPSEFSEENTWLAATVVADRLTSAIANPIIRNAQEQRQLDVIEKWLSSRGYVKRTATSDIPITDIERGTFSFHQNVPVVSEDGRPINMPLDVVIMPLEAPEGSFPVLIEAKSAGDYANTNKRRKEEATKVRQLKETYGDSIDLTLFLCGYFDSAYLGYEAAEGIDWIWEHRVTDLELLLET